MVALVSDLILATYRGVIKWSATSGDSGTMYEMVVDPSMSYVVSRTANRSFLTILRDGEAAIGTPYGINPGGLPEAILTDFVREIP